MTGKYRVGRAPDFVAANNLSLISVFTMVRPRAAAAQDFNLASDAAYSFVVLGPSGHATGFFQSINPLRNGPVGRAL
jgi:hypothetical protein